MKTTILIALVAVAASAATANAQAGAAPTGNVQLRDIPGIGLLFRGAITVVPGVDDALFGPDMPPAPKLDSSSQRTLKLSVLKSSKGDVFQIESARQSRAAIVKKITDVMGVRAVIDPTLEKTYEITQVFRGLSWDDLLASVNFGIEMVKSPAGTYFFADKPTGLTLRIPSNYNSQLGDFVDPRTGLRIIPHGVPRPNPQPDWQKREFNGREFYFIPLPSAE